MCPCEKIWSRAWPKNQPFMLFSTSSGLPEVDSLFARGASDEPAPLRMRVLGYFPEQVRGLPSALLPSGLGKGTGWNEYLAQIVF